MKEITTAQKKYMIEARMDNIAREAYNMQLNLKMYEAYGEEKEVINATRENIRKQELAFAALEQLLQELERQEAADEKL